MKEDLLQRFLTLSTELTGFRVVDLQGTGQAADYLNTVVTVVGEQTLGDLLERYERLALEPTADPKERSRLLSREILSDEKLGPITRNIIKIWYVGIWYELPPEWTESFGVLENDGTFSASPQAYPEGLLWRAIGANPPGARAPGYGSWAQPPQIPALVP